MNKPALIGLLFMLLIGFGSPATYGKSFKMDLTAYNDGNITIHSISTTMSERSSQQEGEYQIKLYDTQGQRLYTHNISPSFKTSGHTVGSGRNLNATGSEISEMRIGVWLPYKDSAVVAKGFYKDEEVSSIDMTAEICSSNDGTCSSYCKGKDVDTDCTCGNDVCEDLENQELCPEDCGDNQDVDEQNRGNEQRDGDQEPSGDTKGIDFRYIYLLIGLLTLSLVWIIFRSEL